ncbi:MAG: hypothetical protein ACHREM_01360 [Polyangiales bacterium]
MLLRLKSMIAEYQGSDAQSRVYGLIRSLTRDDPDTERQVMTALIASIEIERLERFRDGSERDKVLRWLDTAISAQSA